MAATDEALLLSIRQKQGQCTSLDANRGDDDSSCESDEEAVSSPTGLPMRVVDGNNDLKAGNALGVGGAVNRPIASGPKVGLKRRASGCEDFRSQEGEQGAGTGVGVSDSSGGGGAGGSGSGGSGGGGNASDASWSSSDESCPPTVRDDVATRPRGPAFHGVNRDWDGTSPYGSDDDGVSRAAFLSAGRAEAAEGSSKGPGTGSKLSPEKGRGQLRRTAREVRSARKAAPAPSLAESSDGTSSGRSIRAAARAPTRRMPSKPDQAANKKRTVAVRRGLLRRSLPNPAAAAAETILLSQGEKHRPATNARSNGATPTSKTPPQSCRGPRAVHGRQSAHDTSRCVGDAMTNSLAAWEGGVARQKGRPEMGHPRGGGNDSGSRKTLAHQPLGGGQSVTGSGVGGGSGGGEGRENGGHNRSAGGGVCGDDESWVVREFKARVEAARRQEVEALQPSSGATKT